MRSTDVYTNRLLSICAVVLCASYLYGSQYIISYRGTVTNDILTDSSLYVSAAMVKCSGRQGLSLKLKTNGSNNLKTIILNNFDRFSSYMRDLGIEIKSNETYENDIAHSIVVVTLKPQCFTVHFNQNFVKITALR